MYYYPQSYCPDYQVQNPSALRTLYYGNLPPLCTVTGLLNHVKTGALEYVNMLPEKQCAFVTFVESASASAAFVEWQAKKLVIEGYDIKMGWGKPSPLSDVLASAVHQGASRNVYLGNLELEMLDESTLCSIFAAFGVVEHVKILMDKRLAFVHLTGIHDAIKAVTTLSADPHWAHRRIYYGKDRCVGTRFVGFIPPTLNDNGLNTLLEPTIPNRTVYLGGISPEVVLKDIFDVVRGGLVHNIKYMADKNIAFVTFIDHNCADAFFNRGVQDGLSIKNKRVKFGWGKPTHLAPNILAAVQNGASRNVYIGAIDESVTEERLRRDFRPFGDIELINLVPDRNIGFVNFTEIASAIKAVETMKYAPDYLRYKVNFGKDRCGNPPRPSRFQMQKSPELHFESLALDDSLVPNMIPVISPPSSPGGRFGEYPKRDLNRPGFITPVSGKTSPI